MKSLGGGFTKYFNEKHKRSGVLFQGQFKAKHIDTNEYLLHLSTYVNLNNFVHKRRSNMFRSSWNEYLGKPARQMCKSDIILRQFNNRKEYKNFAESSLKGILERKELAKELEELLLEYNLETRFPSREAL